MAYLRTEDGFEFETTRRGRVVRCVCRKDGREATYEIRCSPVVDPDDFSTESMELIARGWWHTWKRVLEDEECPPPDAHA